MCIFTFLNNIVKYIYLLVLSVFVVSCGNKQENKEEIKPKPLMTLVQSHAKTAPVLPTFYDEVKDWKYLKEVDSFFVKYQKISPNEALSNAVELKDLVKSLKDSLKPKKFDIPSVNARINILYNEVLRLADITEISAIEAAEVNNQVDKTMSAFSDINTKINTVLAKIRFENEIDIDVDFIGLDSTRLDTVSKKSIDLRMKEKLIEKNNLDQGSRKRQ